MFSLKNKTAIITGGGSGIGLATAERFHAAGANIVIGDLADSTEVAARLNGLYVKTDVSKEDQVKNLIEKAIAKFGGLDILVNNAGVSSTYKSLMDTDEADFDFCYRINALGPAFGIKHAGRLMNDGGTIVTTASLAGVRGVATIGSYTASKHAVVGITKTAALELAHRNIRVNCICPSTVRTPMALANDGEEFMEEEIKAIPLGRVCEPEEAAALIHFLCADDCAFITGEAINLCGGMMAGGVHQIED